MAMAWRCADHNVIMTPLGVWLTITTTVTVGILLGVVLSWIDPPSWVTPLRLAVILVLAAAADSVVVYIQQTVPVVASASGQDAAAVSDADLVPVSKIDPGQASQAILSITGETSADRRLVESNLNATVHKALGPGPPGGPFAVFDGRELIVAAGTDSRPNASGLGIATTSGALKRTLTSPQADVTDTDPAVTATGHVYFLRTVTQWSGQNGTPLSTTLMEITLSGGRPAVRVRTADPPIYGALSVNAKGTLLAAQCQPPGDGGTTEACVYDLPSGRIRYVTDFDGSAPVTDVSISPDGKYLAYGGAAANPYGGIQIYVRDLATGSTVRVSSQPGNNQQPSWVSGSAAPCLMFSNTETSGNVVYLSCLTAQPGTAMVASGDYPVWLGTSLPAGSSPHGTINWRAQWDKYQSTIMLVLSVIVGLVIGLFSGWLERPPWVTRPRLICAIVILGALQIAGPLTVPGCSGRNPGASRRSPSSTRPRRRISSPSPAPARTAS